MTGMLGDCHGQIFSCEVDVFRGDMKMIGLDAVVAHSIESRRYHDMLV